MNRVWLPPIHLQNKIYIHCSGNIVHTAQLGVSAVNNLACQAGSEGHLQSSSSINNFGSLF